MRQIALESAFILHTRPYRDTSLLVELFTEEHGRVTCIAKGARGKKHPWRHILMPFQPLAVAFMGKSDLLTLTQAETLSLPMNLQAKALFCGFYLNELLLYLLAKQDAYPQLFQLYYKTLVNLKKAVAIEASLRCFERYMLSIIGYEIDFNFDANGNKIVEGISYLYRFNQGFVALAQSHLNEALYQGVNLLAISSDDYSSITVLAQAKKLFGAKIQYLLGNKTLKSREIFRECLLA